MPTLPVWRMNAFTDQPFRGNPAGVVPDADGLTDRQMQQMAPEINSLSETVFICSPSADAQAAEADLRLRFFTSTAEVDLCGHATVAALFCLAERGDLAGTSALRAQTRVGILELGMSWRGSHLQWVSMQQLVPRHAAPSQPQRAASVLGLPAGAVRSDIAVACCSTGIWACFVPLVDRAALAAVRVQSEEIADLWPENPDLTGVYPFVLLTKESGAPGPAGPDLDGISAEAERRVIHTQGRFFSPPKYGIFEDPVTGTASGALGGYLIEQGILPPTGVLLARQGVEMERPGLVRVRRAAGGHMVISGQAVVVMRGEIILPE